MSKLFGLRCHWCRFRESTQGRRERGQNLVEFALVLPVVLLLMIGGYNLGLLFLRITDAGYIAQSAAVSAARYGGYTPALGQSIDAQVQASFLSADRQHFAWRLETRSADGGRVCGGPGPDGPAPGTCTCNWGEQVVVVTTYYWQVDAVIYTWRGAYQTEKSALCWRGVVPGGAPPVTEGR